LAQQLALSVDPGYAFTLGDNGNVLSSYNTVSGLA
jgi:hypothetical protein